MPCSDHAVFLKATAQHGRPETAVLCCGLEKNGMVGAWHGHGMASVNQTRPHYVNQMGKTHSKLLAARYGSGTAWTRHGNGMLCVNRPLFSLLTATLCHTRRFCVGRSRSAVHPALITRPFVLRLLALMPLSSLHYYIICALAFSV